MTPEEKATMELLPSWASREGRRRAYAGLVAKRLWPDRLRLVGLIRLVMMTNEGGIGDQVADDILALAGEDDFE